MLVHLKSTPYCLNGRDLVDTNGQCRVPTMWHIYLKTAVNPLITDYDYQPYLVVEFQSQYHDNPEAKERDGKKATLRIRSGG